MGNLGDKADNGNSLDKSVRLTPTGGIHSGGTPNSVTVYQGFRMKKHARFR